MAEDSALHVVPDDEKFGLDSDLDPLVGREPLLAELRARVRRERLVTLTGPGGVGKTRLAQAIIDAARAERESFFVDLSSLTDGDGLAALLAANLSLGNVEDAPAAVAAWAQSGPRLLALDNLEQVRGVAEPLGALLAVAPTLHVLATSRGPIGVRGEHEVAIPPLALPVDDAPATVEASPAGALFLERCRAMGQLAAELTEATARDVATLCRRLDGLPLALELAAARTRILSPRAILDHLDARGLGILRRTSGEARHRSLEAVIDWTVDLLPSAERRVLEACAACAGSFDLELLGSMVGGADVLGALEALVAQGLVVLDEEVDRTPRFRLLETIRIGVATRLAEREPGLRSAHAAAVLALVKAWAPRIDTAEMRRAVARLDAQRENIDAAIDWAASAEPGLAADLLAESGAYLASRSGSGRPIATCRALLERLSPDTDAHARALGVLARLLTTFDHDAAATVGRQAASIGMKRGLRAVEFDGLHALVFVGLESGKTAPVEARLMLERIETLGPTTPSERRVRASARLLLAFVEGGHERSRTELLRVVAGEDASGSPVLLAEATCNLAYASFSAVRLRDALRFAEEGVAAAAETRDSPLETYGLIAAALAEFELGARGRGQDRALRAVALAASLGTPHALMQALRGCGSIAALVGMGLDAAWLQGAAERAFEPAELPDPADEASYAAARHWRAARRAEDPVAWEVARRDGHDAAPQDALRRAVDVLASAVGSRDRRIVQPLRHGRLTLREVEILTLLGQGRSDPEIAERLFISAKTAAVHVANIKAKLGAENRVEIALRARELGLVA